ncbi:peptidoglycan editing factor PgeF [Larkinella terrae]|uniref:Purine nucleoside phosphorylase n=1 Tax=Larkinella terrae TaxID=2025311 RepID=A0A7K0EIQ0_9BACT|nr:peptidoglycan editing factor PgeF [Larkinella terrae]MRS61602.1 peptidoglycan editing factor PgeF [Larkinella terrae]
MSALASSFIAPPVFEFFQQLIAAESTRHGGISPFPFASLNVGLNTADSPENVQENRRRFFADLGIDESRIASSHQVHGDRILTVTEPGRFEGYDALITKLPNLFLTVTVADCTPILIYDARQQAVAAIHAGWRGTTARIVAKTVQAMQTQFGTQPADCHAYVGTCIDQCSFEVGNEVADQFDDVHKQFDPGRQKFMIDLKAANVAQLVQTGITHTQIGISPYSTVLNNADFFSYRSENGNTGRMLAVIGFQAID